MHRWPLRPAFRSGGRACVALLLIGAGATGCNILSTHQDAQSPGIHDRIRAVDLLPRQTREPEPVGGSGRDGRQPASYFGSADGVSSVAVATAQRAPTGEGFELNFENAPVATLAKVILGDIMGTAYTIDPRVQGTVTLASGRPVAKSDVLYVLENALRLSNVVMVRESRGGGYRLIPGSEAVGSGSVDPTGSEAGYGITVLPLNYISAPTLMRLVDSFAAKPGTVRADAGRNLVLIQGNGAERRAVIDTILSFDGDWMKGQSVGIFPVRNSAPEPLVSELERILDSGEGGLSQSLVKLQIISRQNAILVVTRKPELLKTVATWITRLDASDALTTGVKVYRVRYGDARQMAGLLNDIFVGRAASGLESAANQIAPGGGNTVASSSDRFGERFAGGGGMGGGGMGAGGMGGGGIGGQPQQFSSSRQQQAALASGAIDPQTGAANGGGNGLGRAAFSGGGGSGSGTVAILPGVRITPDVVNNTLLIYANQEHYRVIERTLRQLDRPQLQVSIDATIAEISLNDNLSYGVQFFLKSKDVGLGADKGSVVNTIASAAIGRVLPGFNFLAGSETSPKVILDALQGVTNVKVISTPSVVVIDNQVATLQVGDQVPVATRSAVAVDVPTAPIVNNIDYRNTGVILRVVPRINVNGNVLLDIEQEISNIANTGTANTLTPTISQRKVKSSISVASGQTVLLGGLISERQDRSKSGIPGLMNIPALGDLFASNSGNIQRTELIIFIRPQIIRDAVDASRVAEELRGKMRGHFGSAEPRGLGIPAPPRSMR